MDGDGPPLSCLRGLISIILGHGRMMLPWNTAYFVRGSYETPSNGMVSSAVNH